MNLKKAGMTAIMTVGLGVRAETVISVNSEDRERDPGKGNLGVIIHGNIAIALVNTGERGLVIENMSGNLIENEEAGNPGRGEIEIAKIGIRIGQNEKISRAETETLKTDRGQGHQTSGQGRRQGQGHQCLGNLVVLVK